jgi:NAD-dependent SIR2 family protein deacetylase
VVLTGAGCSTASGIPGYRDEAGRWQGAEPILYGDFVADEALRKRYWARSLNGYVRIDRAQPNAAHRALAGLERTGRVLGLITQNVDGLHGRAGSRDVLELHGNLRTVACLGCGVRIERGAYQIELGRLNPAWLDTPGALRPDGDMALEGVRYDDFSVPPCSRCDGVLKPDVVFYGEAVPKARAERAMQWVRDADALLVVGSSLTVLSGFRLVRDAHRRGIPVVAINRGATRADDYLASKVEASCEDTLVRLLEALE